MSAITIGLAGNPNCGKTTLFNALTGARQKVGNWPGVTVEKKTGSYIHGNKQVEVVDLPGIYSLSATSLDEMIAREYVVSGEPDVIVNIVDASNLERNLYLTVQLLEMKVPLVVALNMMDIVRQRKTKIDIKALKTSLGCPIIPIVANKNKGVDELKEAIAGQAREGQGPSLEIAYPPEVKNAVDTLMPHIQDKAQEEHLPPQWLAIKLLEQDEMALDIAGDAVSETLKEASRSIEKTIGDDPDIVIASARYGFIGSICRQAIQKKLEVRKTISDAIDAVVLNRALGIPLFLLAMYLTFMITINVGGCFIDFFDILFGTICVDGFGRFLAVLHFPQWLITILADGIGGGIQMVSTFIPPIGFMFLCLSILEDSGYMARAAFVMDRFMRVVGLPGKSFVPMLVGFGCNVPAIMATRTLDNERDRILTIAMNPFMSCGARLPVYALFAAAFFPKGGSSLVFGLYLIGIAVAVMTGFILKSTILQGEASHFVMELPPYHLPTVRGVLIHTYDRLKVFMFRAGKVIISIVIVLSFLNALGTDGTFGHEDSGSSVLAAIGKAITPIFHPMGLNQENWPATVGLFTGVFAKEAVVGTLDSLYSATGESDAGKEEDFSLWDGIKEAFASVPAAFSELAGTLTDPLGIGGAVEETTDLEAAAQNEEVSKSTFGAMVKRFDGRIGAFAYLLFVLLYLPCLVAIAAVFRETNAKWTVFVGAYTTLLAWTVATLFYQIATFTSHPGQSLGWIGILLAAFILFVLGLKKASRTISSLGTSKKALQPA